MYRCGEDGASSMLQRAADNDSLAPLERGLVAAKAHLHLGLMHLDGEGAVQSDCRAAAHMMRLLAEDATYPVEELRDEDDAAWREWCRAEMLALAAEAKTAARAQRLGE